MTTDKMQLESMSQDGLLAHVRGLEKKLAEQQAALNEVVRMYAESGSCSSAEHAMYRVCANAGVEELTKREAAARQQGFEDCLDKAARACAVSFNTGRQAGRDEVLTELSEQEPVGYGNDDDGSYWP